MNATTRETVDHRIDDETAIRVTSVASPVTHRTHYLARRVINGYEIPLGQREADTAADALRAALHALTEERRIDAARTSLIDTGIYDDLTAGPGGGIHNQMGHALGGSPAAPGECHHCGLDERICDCR